MPVPLGETSVYVSSVRTASASGPDSWPVCGSRQWSASTPVRLSSGRWTTPTPPQLPVRYAAFTTSKLDHVAGSVESAGLPAGVYGGLVHLPSRNSYRHSSHWGLAERASGMVAKLTPRAVGRVLLVGGCSGRIPTSNLRSVRGLLGAAPGPIVFRVTPHRH